MIWIEKYKPKKFEEIIGLDESVKKLSTDDSKLPNFLFYGPAGTGKTTTAKLIIKERDATFLQLNASDERGIDTVRERIKSFAMTMSPDGTKKIILLDEADQLTKDAFASLRGVMDKYQKNCSFILTCNWFNKIIEPIKSRCVCVEFKTPDLREICSRLVEICEKENIEFTEEGITNIVESTYPDIRRAIKELETIYLREGSITEDTTKRLTNKVKIILSLLKQGKFTKAINIYETEYLNEDKLLVELADELYYGNYSINVKKKSMSLIRKCYVEMSRVETKRLIIRPFLLQLKEILKND